LEGGDTLTGNEIKASVDAYVHAPQTASDTLLYINEALDKISDQGLVFATVEINAEAKTWYEFPNDCTSIIEVEVETENADKWNYYRWQLEGNQIRFADAGTYTIYARRQPEHLLDLTLEPAVNRIYHQAIVTYGKGWSKLKENDESMDGHKKMDEFQQDVLKAFNTLRRKRGPMTWMVIRHA
jgi:hypothetical protein